MKAFPAFVLGLAMLSCSSGARTVTLDLNPRSSCGESTTAYDLSCVRSLEVRVIAAKDGTVLSHTCHSVQYQTLANLVTPAQQQTLLADITAQNNVRIELRGYLGDDQPACQNLQDTALVFWGSSEVVNLSDTTQSAFNVQLECRPDCDCKAISASSPTCPIEWTGGICAPLADYLCRHTCLDASYCYGELLMCESGLCGPADPKGLCGACEGASDCGSGLCVRNSRTGEKFCSVPCPEPGSAQPCPVTISCKQLDSVFSILP